MAGLSEIKVLALMGEWLIKSSAVLLVALLLAWLFRRRSASLRHFILSLFLIGLVFFPLFSSLPGGWEVRWLPSWLAANAATHSPVGTAPIADGIQPNGSEKKSSTQPGLPALIGAGEAAGSKDSSLYKISRILGLILIAGWSFGLLLHLLRLSLGIRSAFRLTLEAERLEDAAWQRLVRRFLAAVSLRRRIDLKSHEKVIVPLTWGFLKPVILMPAQARNWSEDERSSALFHELSHVKRADFLIMVLVRLSLALFWFNPLSWVVFRMLKSEQEKACDELVLKAGIRPSTYAANLLSFKRSAGLAQSPALSFLGVLGMFGRSQLNDRLVAILGQKLSFKEVNMKTKMFITGLAIAAVCLIGLARPSRASSSPENGIVWTDPGLMSAESLSEARPVQESQPSQEKQEKKKAEKAEKEKGQEEKSKKETTIILDTKEGKDRPIEITIVEGNETKTIKLDKPVIIIKKGDKEKKIVVTSKGQELVVAEGEGVQLAIKGDRIEVLKDAELQKVDGGFLIKSIKEGEKGEGKVLVVTEPHVEIIKEAKPLRDFSLHVVGEEGDKRFLVVKPNVAVRPVIAGKIREEALKKKLAETQALLDKIEEQGLDEAKLTAQKETLQELRESLKALDEELKKEAESMAKVDIKIAKPLKSFSVVRPKVLTETAARIAMELDKKGHESYITVFDGKGKYTIVFTGKLRDNQLASYERAVEKVKKGLPEGYELESEYREESGTIILKITGPVEDTGKKELVKKLVDDIREELKK
jgi:beta-lactamase regulating signal transducer with metallopeptidase domain